MDPLLELTVAGSLAVLFAASTVHKLTALDEWPGVVRNYRVLPAALALPAAGVLLIAGALTAAALFWPGTRHIGARRDDDALTCRKSIGFNDDTAFPLRQRAARCVNRMDDDCLCRRNAVTFHEAFGEDLARLQTSGGTVGAEDGNPGLPKPIANACGDGRLRTEDDQVDTFAQGAIR